MDGILIERLIEGEAGINAGMALRDGILGIFYDRTAPLTWVDFCCRRKSLDCACRSGHALDLRAYVCGC